MIEFHLTSAYPHKAYHTAFCCVQCGEVWARLRRPQGRFWFFQNRTCGSCPPGYFHHEVPGSLFCPYDSIDEWGGCKDLPLEALVREVELFAAIDNSTVRDYNESTLLNGQAKMELNTRIAELRNKVVAGTVTREELREAYAALRAARTSASVIREKKKAAEAKPDGAALLAKLAALGSK